MKRFSLCLAFVTLALPAQAQEPLKLIGVAYGSHQRQVLDFYQAKSDKPTPVVFHIHGGGWHAGDKYLGPKPYLDQGVSVVSINYRYISSNAKDNTTPPVKAPLEDAARALQFVRSKAAEWNIDKQRIAGNGASAGGCSALWLALHDDMADPKSDDPVARESTRLYCAAVHSAQVSLDPQELLEWMPNYFYGAHAFGYRNLKDVLKDREKVLPWIKEYSPIEHVSSDDPPIMMFYERGGKPVVGDSPADPTHSAIMGLKLEERLKAVGVDVVHIHPGRPHPKYKFTADYMVDRLKK
jgi:acetyl esterase/lipase